MAHTDWRGDDVLAKVMKAAAFGIDQTMALSVDTAKREHEWENQTGHLEGSVVITEAAAPDGFVVKGTWGATADYSLFVEIGTSRVGQTAFDRAREGEMWSIPGPMYPPGVEGPQAFRLLKYSKDGHEKWRTLRVPWRGRGPLKEARPFLRPAQDEHVEGLSDRIAAAFNA